MADLTVSEKAQKLDKLEAKAKHNKRIQKIQLMRVAEAGSMFTTSVALGAIQKWKPELETAVYGLAQPAAIALVAGGVGYMVTKDGYAREAIGGVFLGGLGKLGVSAGAKLYEMITS